MKCQCKWLFLGRTSYTPPLLFACRECVSRRSSLACVWLKRTALETVRISLLAPAMDQGTFVNSFPSPEKFVFCTDEIESIVYQNFAPRQRIDDCFVLHPPRWGLCDRPLSSHEPLLHEVPFLCYVVYKESLSSLSASILRSFDFLGSEQRNCASLILTPLLLGVPNPNPEKCVPAQASLCPLDYLWTPQTIRGDLANVRPNLDCHSSFYFGFWLFGEPRTCCPVLIRNFALWLNLMKASPVLAMMKSKQYQNFQTHLRKQKVRNCLFCR